MSVEIIEGATAFGFGAADAAIAAKVTQRLPGNLPMALGFELAGAGVGLWGHLVGLGREFKDPILISALALLGARAARITMAGKLTMPGQWGSVGGDGDAYAAGGDEGGGAPVLLTPQSRIYGGARNAPGVRLLGPGRGGSFGLYPSTSEASGVAG